MTAHMAVPAIEPEDIPATVSPKVLTGLLRDELKFQNIIITDAMDMAGLTKEFSGAEASVRAIMAGADVLLMPPDPERAIRAVVSAVESGRIPRQRIDDSATRVLAAKIRVGVLKNKLVNVETVADVLDAKESADSAQRVSDRAVTLVKNEGNAAVPLTNPNQACVIISGAEPKLGQRSSLRAGVFATRQGCPDRHRGCDDARSGSLRRSPATPANAPRSLCRLTSHRRRIMATWRWGRTLRRLYKS